MPHEFVPAQTRPDGKHWHVLPFGAFTRQLCPGGQLPPQIPAPPPGMNPQGIVVVVVEPPAMVVVVAVVVVVVTHTAMPSASLPDWNAARSWASSTASAASMFSASWLARPVQVSAET
jgi:hypothetical protein